MKVENTQESIKAVIAESEFTITRVNQELNKRNGTNYTPQNLNNKIRYGELRYRDILEIADILGYDIEWVKRK